MPAILAQALRPKFACECETMPLHDFVNNMANPTTTPLDEAITSFEQTALSPVVAGELSNWAKAALQSVEQLEHVLVQDVKAQHESIFGTISDTDAEMLTRVQKLQAEDDGIFHCVRETHEIGRTLQSVGATVEPDEEKAANIVKAFVKSAELLIIRLKKQELAVNLWLQESMTRDRGVKD